MSNYSNNVLDETLDNLDLKGVAKDVSKRMSVQHLEYERIKCAMGLMVEAMERREKKREDVCVEQRCITKEMDMAGVAKKIWAEITDEKYLGFSDAYEQKRVMLLGIVGCLYPDATLDAVGIVLEATTGSKCEQLKRRRVEDDA